MSLLLDALKKAADDKKKNLLTDDAEKNTDNTDESLELELNLDSDTEETPDDNDFPEVVETSNSQSITDEPIIQKSTAEAFTANEPAHLADNIIANDAVKDNSTAPADINSEKTDAEDKPIISAPSAEPVTGTTTNTDNAHTDEVIADDKPSITAAPPIAETHKNPVKDIATEKALSALINKSNQYSKQEHLKKTISIAILVTLLIIGSGLFFYIKIDNSNQGIFIADNNQAPVNRILESNKQNTQAVVSDAKNIITKTAPPKKIILNKKSPPAKTTKKSPSIHIVHTEKKDPINTLILEAYSQFHHGDYAQANKLYEQVILREPNNRDALLGLSAIATKQQRYEFARQKYQYLLRLNPKDSVAIAGISSIENAIDPQLNESQLKFILKERPDAAHLYFALGSLYSSQNKWPEAQSAYFSAWSAENKNADYAYNLAISLDHLDKKDQALNFYTLSLKLKQASSGNFSTENTSQRIRTLKGNSE